MNLVKVTGGVPVKYSVRQLRADNPNVSFPSSFPEELLASYSVFPLVVDSSTSYEVNTGNEIVDINGTWTERPTGRSKTDAEKRVRMKCTMRQCRLALKAQGLLANVKAIIASLPQEQKELTELEWEYGNTVERNSALVTSLGGALGLTEVQLDELFALAVTL